MSENPNLVPQVEETEQQVSQELSQDELVAAVAENVRGL